MTTRSLHPTDPDMLQARLASRFVGALGERASALPHDVSERLRFSRERAVERARAVRQALPVSAGSVVTLGSGAGSALLGHGAPWWQRAASWLPLLLLLAGLGAIDRWADREQVLAAAEIDAQLLADDLPPAAYSDPGFAEFLRSPP